MARSQPTPSRSRSRRSDLRWAAGLTLLAWLHRTLFLLSNNDRALPFSGFYHGDAETFFRYARAILDGRTYDSGVPFHPPGFPVVLAAVHGLVGAGGAGDPVPHLAVKLLLTGISSLAVGLLYLLVKPYLGQAVAVLAAALCIYHFGLYVLATAPVSEGVYLSLLLAVLLLWTRALPHPLAAGPALQSPAQSLGRRRGAGLVLGLVLGALALLRAEAQLIALLLVAIGVAGWVRRRPRAAAGLVPWLLVAVGFAAALTPWTVRNHRHLGDLNRTLAPSLAEPLPTFVPLTVYGPLNLALANHAGADGTFSRERLSSQKLTGRLELTDPQHLEFLLHGDELAWRYIKARPGDWLRLVGRKWDLMLDATRLGWTQWNWPGGLTGVRRPVDVFVPYSGLATWLWLPWVIAGLALCLVRGGAARRWALLVALLTAATLAVTALFFGYARLGLLLMPLWATLAAAAMIAAARRLARRWPESLPHPRRPWRWAAAAALLLLALESWGATLDRRYEARGTTLAGQRYLNPDLEVRIRPLP